MTDGLLHGCGEARRGRAVWLATHLAFAGGVVHSAPMTPKREGAQKAAPARHSTSSCRARGCGPTDSAKRIARRIFAPAIIMTSTAEHAMCMLCKQCPVRNYAGHFEYVLTNCPVFCRAQGCVRDAFPSLSSLVAHKHRRGTGSPADIHYLSWSPEHDQTATALAALRPRRQEEWGGASHFTAQPRRFNCCARMPVPVSSCQAGSCCSPGALDTDNEKFPWLLGSFARAPLHAPTSNQHLSIHLLLHRQDHPHE